jgi:tRNA-2-methylthio-N6-dimethylallyladenosine synthase
VGFPGETEADFQDTLSLVREAGFVSVFAFKYSPRPHTPALRLGDTISEELKTERLARLFEVSDAQQAQHLRSLLGRELLVLLESPSKSDATRFTGRSERHEIVHVTVPAGHDPTGELARVRVIEANKRSLIAEPIVPWRVTARVEPLPKQPPRKSALRLPVVPV